MTKRARRETSSMSFSLSRWYRRISESKPSAATVVIIVLGFTAFLLGGGLLTIITQPPPTIYTGSRFYFIYPSMDQQLGMDTVFSAMLYVMGLVGILLMYQSTKSAYRPRNAYMSLIVGITLLVLAYVFLEWSLAIKEGILS